MTIRTGIALAAAGVFALVACACGGDGAVALDCEAYCNVQVCRLGVDRHSCMAECPCVGVMTRDYYHSCINECGAAETCAGVVGCECDTEDAAHGDRAAVIQDACVDYAFRCNATADGCPNTADAFAGFRDAMIDRLLDCYTIPCNADLLACKNAAWPPECE